MPDGPSRYTRRASAASRTWRDLADQHRDRRPRVRILDEQAPLAASTPSAADRSRGPSGARADDPAGRQLALVQPSTRTARRGATSTRPSRRRGTAPSSASGRPAGRRPPRAARSSSRPARAGSRPPRQSALMPMPDDGPRIARPEAARSRPARRPACDAVVAARRPLDDEVVRPLEPDGAVGSPATVSAASAIASETIAASRQTRSGASHVGRKPSDSRSAAPARRDPRPALPAATRRLLVGDGQADLRRPVGQPAAHDVVRRADARRIARRGRGRRSSRRAPARSAGRGATSTVSGRSSSKASWSARRAVSSSSSAMMQVMRTSDVEIISMLTPASASAPNIRAA